MAFFNVRNLGRYKKLSYTADQLSAIQEARARGVLEAWLPDGSRIKYRSLEEMDQIISDMNSELGTNPTHTNIAYPRYRNGFQ